MMKILSFSLVCDRWAFGVLLYEMLVGQPPFDGEDEEELFASITEHSPSYPKSLSKEAKEFCRALMVKNPSKRLGSGLREESEIKGHPFFRRIDWIKIEKLEIQPPFIPTVKNPRSAENFDPAFTNAKISLTPSDETIINNLRGDEFQGFTYVNPTFASTVFAESEEQESSHLTDTLESTSETSPLANASTPAAAVQ